MAGAVAMAAVIEDFEGQVCVTKKVVILIIYY